MYFRWLLCLVSSQHLLQTTSTIASQLRQHLLTVSFKRISWSETLYITEYNANILLCTYHAFGKQYNKHTIAWISHFFISPMFPISFCCIWLSSLSWKFSSWPFISQSTTLSFFSFASSRYFTDIFQWSNGCFHFSPDLYEHVCHN